MQCKAGLGHCNALQDKQWLSCQFLLIMLEWQINILTPDVFFCDWEKLASVATLHSNKLTWDMTRLWLRKGRCWLIVTSVLVIATKQRRDKYRRKRHNTQISVFHPSINFLHLLVIYKYHLVLIVEPIQQIMETMSSMQGTSQCNSQSHIDPSVDSLDKILRFSFKFLFCSQAFEKPSCYYME